MVATLACVVISSTDGAPLMIRFDNDHHGTLDAEGGAVHHITESCRTVRPVGQVAPSMALRSARLWLRTFCGTFPGSSLPGPNC
jgi:hypothetical protein